jgi:hypothetical protein
MARHGSETGTRRTTRKERDASIFAREGPGLAYLVRGQPHVTCKQVVRVAKGPAEDRLEATMYDMRDT